MIDTGNPKREFGEEATCSLPRRLLETGGKRGNNAWGYLMTEHGILLSIQIV